MRTLAAEIDRKRRSKHSDYNSKREHTHSYEFCEIILPFVTDVQTNGTHILTTLKFLPFLKGMSVAGQNFLTFPTI